MTTTTGAVRDTTTDWPAKAAAEREAVAACYRRSAESWERSDTDGFLSQWASDASARRHEAAAELADHEGLVEMSALFLLDGTLASTHRGEGQYGPYWVLNDEAAARLGRRFLSTSEARKGQRRYDANAKKGVRLGTIRVAGHIEASAGLMPTYYATGNVDDLKAGRFDIVSTDDGPGSDWA